MKITDAKTMKTVAKIKVTGSFIELLEPNHEIANILKLTLIAFTGGQTENEYFTEMYDVKNGDDGFYDAFKDEMYSRKWFIDRRD